MSKIYIPMFNIRDMTGNFHSFDPRLVTTVTTYKVNNTGSEWRCEVHIGLDEPDSGRHEQLFLIRQNTQEEVVAIAQRVHSARESALQTQRAASLAEMTEVTKGVFVDASMIVYIGKNIHESHDAQKPQRFTLNVSLKFSDDNSRSYSYDFASQEELDAAHARLLAARRGVGSYDEIINSLLTLNNNIKPLDIKSIIKN